MQPGVGAGRGQGTVVANGWESSQEASVTVYAKESLRPGCTLRPLEDGFPWSGVVWG